MTAKIFSINDVALNDEQVRALNEMKAAQKRREGKAAPKKDSGRVVVVPFSWRVQLKGRVHWAVWPVALHLLHLDWKAGGRPFKVTNPGVAEWGVDRWQKQVALGVLEAAGLIRTEGEEGKTTVVTILIR